MFIYIYMFLPVFSYFKYFIYAYCGIQCYLKNSNFFKYKNGGCIQC